MATYYVYITTNPRRTVLYIGISNDLSRRLREHHEARGNPATFAGRYYCYELIYYETFDTPTEAIAREKVLKGWRRQKKEDLIAAVNPEWMVLEPPMS